jgi:hypothetical protein
MYVADLAMIIADRWCANAFDVGGDPYNRAIAPGDVRGL